MSKSVHSMLGATREQTEEIEWDDESIWKESGFQAFLDANSIKRSDLLVKSSLPRFFRIPRNDQSETVLASITKELHASGHEPPHAVRWLPGFYSIPGHILLSKLTAYDKGHLHGIDASSGFAITLLDLQPSDHVLDLCCAPGAKLTFIAELLRKEGSVTGVDVSRSRLGACRQLVYKQQLHLPPADGDKARWRCRLLCADGRKVCVGPADDVVSPDVEEVLDTWEIEKRGSKGQGRKRKNKSARAREKKQKVEVASRTTTEREGYTKVLVDAECTHDGSIRHLQRLRTKEEWGQYVSAHLNDEQLDRVRNLQRDLIRNGFRLLDRGGVLIYSTCSLSVKQNEDIVSDFLQEHSAATIVPIDRTGLPCQEGGIPGTVRFTPAQATSGLFIARLRKT